ncbi:MAG: ATP-binding protein [Desulfosalsimonadaceae bacterium]
MPDVLLIVDHDRELAQALAVYLRRHQFEVMLADSDLMALEIIHTRSPAIVLVDPHLPETDPLLFLQQMKDRIPYSQFIIYGPPDSLESIMETFHTRALTYIRKPVSSIELDFALKKAGEWTLLESEHQKTTQKIKELQNAQTLLQQLFDEVPCYITVQDQNFRMTTTNRLFKRDFGNDIGGYCYQIYKHRDTPCTDCPVAATFQDGRRHQTEEVVTSKSGVQYHVLTWTAPIRNEAGEITQVMEMATNITQIRQLQDHLTSLGLMLGSMSHGIKGMLTALDGGIYLLETGINRQDEKRIARAFDQVRQMVARIRKMVLDILYFTKSRELQYREVDICELAESIADVIRPSADRHDITFTVTLPSPSVRVELDPDRLREALINFLENAVDACVSDTNRETHHIAFDTRVTEDGRVCFDISDDGLGMDRETKEKMFTLFFSSKGSKGTGLGLFIANHVIGQHGGTILVESEINKGSRFTICIPRTREKMDKP